jgi:CDP-6-deoxy-D-xylo-4-hexulose-3-dehydrase
MTGGPYPNIEAFVEQASAERAPFLPGETFIPASGKLVGRKEKALMIEAVLDGWLTIGRFNTAFEAALRAFIGVRHAFTVNSGSSANLVALSALTPAEWDGRAIRPGDEVITTALGFPTTIAPILQIGAVPVFVDVALDTWNADVKAVEKAVTPKTKAVVLAHTLGIPYDGAALSSLCRERGLWLVEDCCDALGAEYDGRRAGTFGDVATLSFYPAHHVTTGEGGAVLTGNEKIGRLAESFRDWGRHCRCRPGQDNACGRRFNGRYGELPEGYDHKYVYAHAGFNLKMTDMAAACGVAQMERLPDFLQARRENYGYLHKALCSCPGLRLPVLPREARPSWFGFPILLEDDAPCGRAALLAELDRRNIGIRLPFAGNAVRQPFMRDKKYRISGSLENSDRLMRSGFWIGVWPGLDAAMLGYAARSLREILGAPA